MWPPWPRCPPAQICQSWRKTRAEPGLALIAFSIDFSRLPQAAVSIKIPGIIIQIRKMMRFLCLRLGLYSQLKDGSWKSLSWGYSWVSNDLMVKIKLVLQRITSIKFSRDNIWCKINFTEVWLACLCCTYLGQILALNFQMYKGKVKKVEFIGCCKEWFEILFNIFFLLINVKIWKPSFLTIFQLLTKNCEQHVLWFPVVIEILFQDYSALQPKYILIFIHFWNGSLYLSFPRCLFMNIYKCKYLLK